MQNLNKLNKQKNTLSLVNKTQRGFTLLEVMLVIVIMATIVVFSIGIFQQQAINAQIDKTSLQMQQWLEAAKAYYVDNTAWPNGNNFTGQGTGISCVGQQGIDPTALLLEGQCGPLAQNNKTYIQSGASIENNAWGQAFTLLPPAEQTNQNSGMFQVVSSLPVNLKNVLTIAERLAARLPNATVGAISLDGAPLSVIAGVTVPGSASTGGINIKSLQNLSCARFNDTCATLTKPDCPSGMVPNIYLSLQGFKATNPGAQTSTIGPVSTTAQTTSDNKGWNIILTVQGVSTVPVHEGTVLAVLTCEAPTANNKPITNTNFTY